MIPGYNHNVKYKDKVYHVQTEDSGIQNPHVITHLFVGGNIVESRKTSYAQLVGSARLSDELVEIMQDQHKGMLKDLINGRFDDKIVERSVNAATLNGPAPLNVDAGAQHRASFGMGSAGDTAAPASAKAKQAAAATAKTATPSAAAVTPASKPLGSLPNATAPLSAPRPPPMPPTPLQQPPASVTTPPRPSAQPIAAQAAPPRSPTFGVPPPPKSPQATPIGAPAAIARPVPPPAPIAKSPPAPVDGIVLEAETLARAFESKDESAVDSIFGEDLISEKSLDEVILSYLADDLQKE